MSRKPNGKEVSNSTWVKAKDGTYVRRSDQSAYLKSESNRIISGIDALYKGASLDLEIQFRHDQRRIYWGTTISKAVYSLSIAWLKTIPVVGGYIGLLNKVLMNPGGGAWEVMRSSYGEGGSAWNLWGEDANGVSSPLTLSPTKDGGYSTDGYNLATGSPTLFQTDNRLKREQAESEMMTMLNIPGIKDWMSGSSSAVAREAAADLQGIEYRALLLLEAAYKKYPAWVNLHAMAAASMADIGAHDGIRDLNAGTVTNSTTGDLYGKSSLQALKSQKTFMAKHTFGSNLYKLLTHFESSTGRDKVEKDLQFPKTTLQAVQRIKAKYIAYWYQLTQSSMWSSLSSYVCKYLKGVGNGYVRDTGVGHEAEERYQRSLGRSPNLLAEDEGAFRGNVGGRLIGAMGFIHEIIAAYFGSGRICSLPATPLYAKQIAYCMEDCALIGASYMTRDTTHEKWASWLSFFRSALAQMPELVAFKQLYAEKQPHSPALSLSGIVVPGASEFAGYGGTGWKERPTNFTPARGRGIDLRPPFAAPASTAPSVMRAPGIGEDVKKVAYRGISPKVRDRWGQYKAALDALKKTVPAADPLHDYITAHHEMLKALMDEAGLRKSSIKLDDH